MRYNTLEIMSTFPLRYESIAWSTAVYICIYTYIIIFTAVEYLEFSTDLINNEL